MIGGRFVVRDRQLLTVDLPALGRRAEALRSTVVERTREKRSAFECVAPVLYQSCPALSARPWHVNRYCGC